MKLVLCSAALLVSTFAVHAEPAPTIEQLASRSTLIVYCRPDKGPDGAGRFAVVETWKGAYNRDAFSPAPAQGFLPGTVVDRGPDGEAVLFFSGQGQSAGKFTRCDAALPVIGGKVIYPAGASRGGTGKEYTLVAFKAQIQSAVKYPLVNGDFDASPAGSAPEGWKPAYPTGGAVVATDGKDTFLRLTNAQPQNAGMAQDVPVPEGATQIAVLGRMRGKPRNEKDEKRAAVEVALRFKDAKDGSINAAVVASGGSAAWHTFRREFKVPPGCATVEVVARSIFAIGTFDFDAVRVEFK